MGNLTDIGYGVGKYLEVSDASGIPDIGANRTNIDLLNFKVATNNAYALYNFKDGMIDAYQTQTGVDAAASINEIYDSSGKYYSGEVAGNYFGDGSLGNCTFGASSITQTSDTTAIDTVLTTGSELGGPGSSSYGHGVPYNTACYEFTVLNKIGSYDGDMFVANFKDLTINASVTLTTDQPGRGFLIYVDGNCIINGALSLTSRGGFSDPTSSGGSDSSAVSATGLRIPLLTSAGTDTLAAADFAGAGTSAVTAVANHTAISGNGNIYVISKTGGAGGGSNTAGTAGTTGGATISTGGGGGGRIGGSGTGGSGGTGGAFSSGSAAGSSDSIDNRPASNGAPYGGAGGQGKDVHSGGPHVVPGGGGNPGGSGDNASSGRNGVGGIIFILVKGDITIGASGSIEAESPDALEGTSSETGYGMSTPGGGAIHVFHGGSLTNNGSISAVAGTRSVGTHGNQPGYSGGNGGTNSAQITADTFNNIELKSNTQTAVAAPTTGRLMIYEETSTGSTTLDTDLKGYVSRDGGTTYTQTPLTLDATYETGKTLVSGSIDISGQPSGTNMKYKIETLNQSASKVCRLHGASLLWA